MTELSIQELANEVGGALVLGHMPPLDGELTPLGRIVTDSRQVEPGDVFWALVGRNANGSDYAEEAYARGASGVVACGRRIEPWAGRWSLRVEDSQRALWQVAALVRQRFAGHVVAVTGSVGKTTTRQMIHSVLGREYHGSASPRNYNNHVGVPLSILSWSDEDDYGVLEMGASAEGEIGALAALASPEIGVITCIADAHLGGFGSQRAVAEAKCELLTALPERGWAVLGDDPWLRRMARKCPARIVWVGRSADCDVIATDVQFRGGVLSFRIDRQRFRVPVWGRHYLTSALAAVAVGQLLGLEMHTISEALWAFEQMPQRCEVLDVEGVTVINDTYNSCPQAMHAALELLRDFDSLGRRIVVCGDMLELGPMAEACHRKVGDEVVTVAGADTLIACGEFAREVVSGARSAGMPGGRAIACARTCDALPFLQSQVAPGDVVLVKGSRGMAMEQLVAALAPKTRARAA